MEQFATLSSSIIGSTYAMQGNQAIQTHFSMFNDILSRRGLPEQGWDDLSIELGLSILAAMDSNHFSSAVGLGEREGRVFSPLVARRHYGFSHGIGRSGDINAVQPKAAGSSLLLQMTTMLVRDALRCVGLRSVQEVLLLPICTGMTLSLCMSTLKSLKFALGYFSLFFSHL